MKKSFVMTSVALAALTLAVAAQAAPTPAGKGAHGATGFVATDKTLYNNTGTDSGLGIVSQNFESSFDIYDAAAADDFKVPRLRKWTVDEVDVTGVYFNGSGPARSEQVTFYRNANGHPGALVATYDDLSGADNGTGSFMIPIPKTRLKHGTYWVSVVINMDFGSGGEWGWENMLETRGNPANWENPGGGFGIGCTTWEVESTCIPDGQGDHFFMIKGRQSLGL